MPGKNDIHNDPNHNTNGFKQNPENAMHKGRPPKLISHVNKELKTEGYSPATKQDITDAIMVLMQLPMSKIMEIANLKSDEHPFFVKLVAKELIGKRGGEAMEKYLDRAIGKAKNEVDVKGTGFDNSPSFKIIVQEKATADELEKLNNE